MLQNDDRLAELIKRRGPQPESDTSLWACLSRCVNYKDGSPLPLQSVAANAGIFFAAGYETTAHAISWALFELAADRAIQVGIFFAAGYASTAHPISWALAVSIGSRYSCAGWPYQSTAGVNPQHMPYHAHHLSWQQTQPFRYARTRLHLGFQLLFVRASIRRAASAHITWVVVYSCIQSCVVSSSHRNVNKS